MTRPPMNYRERQAQKLLRARAEGFTAVVGAREFYTTHIKPPVRPSVWQRFVGWWRYFTAKDMGR